MKHLKSFETEWTDNTLRLPENSSLQGCVRCFMTRNIASDANKFFRSIIPASPFPGINWAISGQRSIIERDGNSTSEPLPYKNKFFGPRDHHIILSDSAGTESFDVVFQPDAPYILFGLDAAMLLNQEVPVGGTLPNDWLPMMNEVFDAPHHDERQRIIERFLAPRWASARQHYVSVHYNQPIDWLICVAARVAISKTGSSIRQLERRFRRMTGLTHKHLKTLSRGEQALLAVRDLVLDGQPTTWSEIAAEMGFYDQAHLCNETKRLTGYTPQELVRLGRAKDDAFWVLQLWA